MSVKARWLLAAMLILVSGDKSLGQAECFAWGGLRGVRVDGELMAFTTGLRAVRPGSEIIGPARAERLSGVRFHREGDRQICAGGLRTEELRPGSGPAFGAPSPLTATVVFEDSASGTVTVDITARADADVALRGIYFFVHLPAKEYSAGSAELVDAAQASYAAPLASTRPGDQYIDGLARGLRVRLPRRQFELESDSPLRIVMRDGRRTPDADYDVFFPLSTGILAAGQTVHAHFTLKASGSVDKAPVHVTVDPSRPGSPFDGIGGNFRIQSAADPAQIQYNLDHLRVAWGRVAMPLDRWQPIENENPIDAAETGKLDAGVRAAMEMARTLAQRNIPFIISDWSAPDWALEPRPAGRRFGGRRINPRKWPDLCAAIGSYLQYLKRHYAAEPRLFSFNETNIGIYVLQSPEEHAEAIKQLGAYFASHGLATKMLMGDTGDPPPVDFVNAAMADAQAVKYIGAVSFHSWHGGTDEQFARWRQAAKKLNVPLIVAEGGTDSDAYAYPNIFLEPWYGLEEISLYANICRIAQPLSILQWQLTRDYSVLSGGADGSPLEPTQRFWNLKQLDLTPQGSAALPVTCDAEGIAACAYMDAGRQTCAVDLVSREATRQANISGLPPDLKQMRVYVTDATRGMKEMPPIAVSGGAAQIVLDTQSFTTLLGGE
jgi:O-glycosyl hydrolase